MNSPALVATVMSTCVTLAFALACGGATDDTDLMVQPSAPAPPDEAPIRPPSATPPADDEQACSVGAIVADPDPKGLNVRDAPSGEVVGQLFEGTEVGLAEARDGWVRLDHAWHAERDEEDWPLGWVHGSLLTTFLKTPLEYGPDTQPVLRAEPRDNATSTPIAYEPEPTISVIGCAGEFLEVKVIVPGGAEHTGWLGKDSHCASTVTTCS